MNGGDSLCKTCDNSIGKNNGKYPLGRIEERMSGDIMKFKANNGKLVSSFGDVIKRLQISRNDVEKYANEQGITIPESQFAETKKKRGRPRKEVSTYDTDNEDDPNTESTKANNVNESNTEVVEKQQIVKRGRGRPKKDKKIISTKTIQNNYISELFKEAQNKIPDEINNNREKNNDANFSGNESSSDESSSDESSSDESSSDESSSDESSSDDDCGGTTDSGDDVEQINVVCVTFNGKQYLKSVEDNLMYDKETEEHVGFWKNGVLEKKYNSSK